MLVFNIDEQWVVDLVEVQNISKFNKGMRYLLMLIDAFSKYAWVEPIKSKTGKAVTEAFEKILKRTKGRKPINLQTDDGKEFHNSTFAALMKQKNIHHFSTSGDTKASIVERTTVLSRKGYVDILQSTSSAIYWCCQIWSKDTMHPTIALLAWHLTM